MNNLSISCCMIVKNEEKRLGRCLESLKPFGFELVIVDTGSEDGTVRLASEYTDKVFHFPWQEDFSAARNYSLSRAGFPYIFMMDADEWIVSLDPEEIGYLRKKLPDQVGVVTRQNMEGNRIGTTDHTERFFSRRLYHYRGRIHEMLAPIRGKELPCLLTSCVIGHSGYDMSPEERAAKAWRNEHLLLKELEENKDPSMEPYLYYQLGKAAEILEDYEKACACFEKTLSYPLDPSLAYVEAGVLRFGLDNLLLGRIDEAQGIRALTNLFPESPDFAFVLGEVCRAAGLKEEAEAAYQKALSMPAGSYPHALSENGLMALRK